MDTRLIQSQLEDELRGIRSKLKPRREEVANTHATKEPSEHAASGVQADVRDGVTSLTREKEIRVLAALRRIEQGTYGICRGCGEEISPARLNAESTARRCIKCQEKAGPGFIVRAPSHRSIAHL